MLLNLWLACSLVNAVYTLYMLHTQKGRAAVNEQLSYLSPGTIMVLVVLIVIVLGPLLPIGALVSKYNKRANNGTLK